MRCDAKRASVSLQARPGFTLLEAVVALAVVALVAVSALATVGEQLRVASRARFVERAEGLASQRLASLRLLSPDQIRSLPDTIRAGRFSPPDAGYVWRVTSAPVANEQDLEDVRVEVRWDNGSYTLRSRLYAPSLVVQVPR